MRENLAVFMKVTRTDEFSDHYVTEDYFFHIRRILREKMGGKLVDKFADSGEYHVCKLEYVVREVDFFQVEYGLVAHLSVARQMDVTFANPSLEFNGYTYERVCRYCGSKLHHDARGGCSACGAPNGGHK